MPLDETIVGKEYSAGPYLVGRRDAILYALATGDDNPAYYFPSATGEVVTPPMFAARYARTPIEPIKQDPEIGLNLKQLVHYSQEFHWISPVHTGDRIFSRAAITHLSIRENGSVLGIGVIATNQEGLEVVRAKWELFDRSAGIEGAGKPDTIPDPEGERIGESTRHVSAIQPYSYAEASGDRNPIHVDEAYARRAGLPGTILHGMCTMAFTHQFAVRTLCGSNRDPFRLKQLHVQFSRPVAPCDSLKLTCCKIDSPRIDSPREGVRYGIRVLNQQDKPVLRNAWCVVA